MNCIAAAFARRQVALGRSLSSDQWQAAFAQASSRSAWKGARHLVQSRRDKKAAKRFFRKLLKGLE
jgi:hypothetical protein